MGTVVSSENEYTKRKRDFTRGFIEEIYAAGGVQEPPKTGIRKAIVNKVKDSIFK